MSSKLFNASLLTACVLLATTSPASASGYTFTDLGTLVGRYSTARGINNSGQVVGQYSISGDSDYHAVIWDGTALHTPTDLGTLGRSDSIAVGINNAGQVAGYSYTDPNSLGDYVAHAVIWDGTALHKPTDLGTPLGGSVSGAWDINDSGQVVGMSYTLGDTTQHAIIGGQGSLASGINNSGQVVGWSSTSGNNVTLHAIIWDGTALHTPTDLGTLGGSHSFATGINDSGQVVGYSSISGNFFPFHAAIWNGTTPTDLGTLGGGFSVAFGINNAGQVVGYSTITIDRPETHATIWNGTTPTDLNNFLSVSDVAHWVLETAHGINDSGWIIGSAYSLVSGERHAFLLTPVPEPETYALFMAGLGLMGFIARRRKNGQA